MQPRYSGRWWVDERGNEWSAFDLWKGRVFHSLERGVECDERGMRLYRNTDGEVLRLVRIPPPGVSADEKEAFYEEWEERGRPPGTE